MKFDLESFNENKVFKSLAIIIATVFLIYPIIIFLIWGKWESGGLFGDSFGMISSLFSGLAVILLIITLIIQKKEYRITREEFELSRKAQEQSSKALLLQANTLKVQQFETLLFKLIDIFHSSRNDVHRDFFDRLRELYRRSEVENSYPNDLANWRNYYEDRYEFQRYLKSLLNLLYYIDHNYPVDDKSEMMIYFDIVIKQFTQAENEIFTYLTELYSEKFNRYVEKYNLLDLLTLN